MSVTVFRDGNVFLAGYNLGGQIKSIALDYGAEPLDATVMGSTTRTRAGGLKAVGLGYEGFWLAGAASSGPDAALFSRIGTASVPATVTPQGASEGALAYLLPVLNTQYTPHGTVGELMGFGVKAEGDMLARGQMLHRSTAEVSDGGGTAFQVGTSTDKIAYAALHVIGREGTSGTLDVIIQSAATSGFGAPTTRITFTQALGSTGEWGVFASGTTDNWWRISRTVTANAFDFAVSFAIQAGTS